jgi:hypothetical protein
MECRATTTILRIRRHKAIKDSSRSDLPNPEDEAIGRVPWINSTICVNILFFPLGGLDPRVVRSNEYKVIIKYYGYYFRYPTRLVTTRDFGSDINGSEEPDKILMRTPRNKDLFPWSINKVNT